MFVLSGFDVLEDPREELLGVLTGDTLGAPLCGVVLLADITLINTTNIFELSLINNLYLLLRSKQRQPYCEGS